MFLRQDGEEEGDAVGGGELAAGWHEVAGVGGQAGAQGVLLLGGKGAAVKAPLDAAEDFGAAHRCARCVAARRAKKVSPSGAGKSRPLVQPLAKGSLWKVPRLPAVRRRNLAAAREARR